MLKFLLGLNELPYEGGRLSFASSPPAEALLAVIAVAALLAWFTYRNLRNGMPKGAFFTLIVLRASVLLLVFACFLGPQWTTPKELTTRRSLVVLIDDSASMDRRDANYTDEQLAELAYACGLTKNPGARPDAAIVEELKQMTRAQIVKRVLANHTLLPLKSLGEQFNLKQFKFAKTVLPADENLTDEQRESSALGSAIREIVQKTSGDSIAAVLLISDSGQNFGPHPIPAARFAAGQGLQIFTVGIGGKASPKDIAIEPVDYREVVFKGDEVVISTSIAFIGFEGDEVSVRLTAEGVGSQEKKVAISGGAGKAPVSFSMKLEKAGDYKFTITAEQKPDEAVVTNNSRTFGLKVVEDKIRVLAVFGAPTWEYRFLKHALMRDPTMECTVLLQRQDGTYFYEGSHSQKALPEDFDSMLKFDVVIVADIAVKGFVSATQVDLIERFVGEAGGGYIYVAGEINGISPLVGTKLETLLPVKVAPMPLSRNFSTSFRPSLTAEGERHPAFRFSPDEKENHQIWSSLPMFYWHYPAFGVKPGAEVLLEHPLESTDGKPVPLAVQAYYGAGRVFYMGLDSMWRWRKEVGDRYFYRYWGQLIRHCGQERLLGGGKRLSLSTDLPEYKPASIVRLLARALDRELKPLEVPSLEAEVIAPDGTATKIALVRDETRKAVFRGETTAFLPGEYKARVRVEDITADTSFVVHFVSPENSTLALDEDLLTAIAAETGAEYINPSRISELPRLIASKPQKSVEFLSESLLSAPIIYLLFVLLLASEWIIRRLVRLL